MPRNRDVKACTDLKFQAGSALEALTLALLEELWTMFAVETPGIFADEKAAFCLLP